MRNFLHAGIKSTMLPPALLSFVKSSATPSNFWSRSFWNEDERTDSPYDAFNEMANTSLKFTCSVWQCNGMFLRNTFSLKSKNSQGPTSTLWEKDGFLALVQVWTSLKPAGWNIGEKLAVFFSIHLHMEERLRKNPAPPFSRYWVIILCSRRFGLASILGTYRSQRLQT